MKNVSSTYLSHSFDFNDVLSNVNSIYLLSITGDPMGNLSFYE